MELGDPGHRTAGQYPVRQITNRSRRVYMGPAPLPGSASAMPANGSQVHEFAPPGPPPRRGLGPVTGTGTTLPTTRGTSRRVVGTSDEKAPSTVPTQRQGTAQRTGTPPNPAAAPAAPRAKRATGAKAAALAGTLASRAKAATVKAATVKAATAKAADRQGPPRLPADGRRQDGRQPHRRGAQAGRGRRDRASTRKPAATAKAATAKAVTPAAKVSASATPRCRQARCRQQARLGLRRR